MMIGWSTPIQALERIADEEERRHAQRVMDARDALNEEWFREWGHNLNERLTAWNADVERISAAAPPRPRCQRAGITTNRGHGTPKARRQMAKASRRRNRA